MNELYNTATTSGDYNNIPISFSSNTSIVNISLGLELTLETNKTKWKYGNLTYQMKLTNISNTPYLNLVITDSIDAQLIEVIPDSIIIDGVKATQKEYFYNKSTNILTIYVNKIESQQTTEIAFNVRKKRNIFFILKNWYVVTYNNDLKLRSNSVTIISPITKSATDNTDCSSLNWRP